MARSALESCPRPSRAVPIHVADLVLAATLAGCGGGGSGSADLGTPLAAGPSAPVAVPSTAPSAPSAAPMPSPPAASEPPAPSAGAPSPSATPPAPTASPPAPTPAPPASVPATLFTALVLDPAGQAGRFGLNNHGQAAWTSATPDGEFGRFFDGTTTQPVEGNRRARAVAINDAGLVTGQLLGDSISLAFRWDPTAPDVLMVTDYEPGFFLVASGINRSGQVAGSITRRNVQGAYRWTSGPAVEGLQALAGPDSLPAVGNGLFINDSGTVAGVSSTAGGPVHAALWVPGHNVRDLGTLGGSSVTVDGLNNAGQVAGQSDVSAGVKHAYRWSDADGMVDLGTLGGPLSAAGGINGNGWVIGASSTADGGTFAFLWRDGHMQSLGALGGMGSTATAINASGQVGGTYFAADGTAHAFLWSDAEGMVDLSSRLAGESPPALRDVIALADDGSLLASSSAGLVLVRPKTP